MYPKMKPDLYYEQQATGVKLACAGRTLVIGGRSSYALLEYLMTVCDGTRTLTEVLAPFPETQGQQVTSLINQLTAHRIMRDAQPDQLDAVIPTLARQYGATLTYLETLVDDPFQRFAALRKHTVSVIGDGSALRSLVPALWEAGLAHGTVQLLSSRHAAGLRRRLATQMRRDPQTCWTVLTSQTLRVDWSGPAPSLVIGCGSARDVTRWQAQAVSAGLRYFPVIVSEAFSTIGPLVLANSQVGCAECLAAATPLPPPQHDTFTSAAFVGARAALEIFGLLTETGRPARDHLVCVDAEELTDTTHRVLARHHCRVCAPNRAPALETHDLVDVLTGPVHSCDPEDLPQLPVALCLARVGQQLIVAGGRDLDEAGRRAVFAALTLRGPGDLRVAAADKRAALALGWLGHLRRTAAVHDLGQRLSASDLQAQLHRDSAPWWKTLELFYELSAEVWQWHDPQSSAVVTLLRDQKSGEVVAQNAGSEAPESLELALLDALCNLQAGQEWPIAAAVPLAALGQNAAAWAAWLPERVAKALYWEPDEDDLDWAACGLVVGQAHIQTPAAARLLKGTYVGS